MEKLQQIEYQITELKNLHELVSANEDQIALSQETARECQNKIVYQRARIAGLKQSIKSAHQSLRKLVR